MSKLADELTGFWSQAVWLTTDIPIPMPKTVPKCYLRFATHSEGINNELKYAFKHLITTGQWSLTDVGTQQYFLNKFTEYINHHQPQTTTLLQHPLSYSEEQFIAYLAQKGLKTHYKTYYYAKTGCQRTSVKVTSIVARFRRLYQIVADYYDTRDEWDKDLIDVRRLGLNIPPGTERRYFNLSNLTPLWLRESTRQVLRSHASRKSFGTLSQYLVGLTTFSRFLTSYYPSLTEPNELKRQVIIDFIAYLRQNRKDSSIASTLGALNVFLTTSVIHGFADLPKQPLLYRQDFPKQPRPRPKFIPDEVHQQIMAQLEHLKEPYRTMLAILEQTGARIGEVLGLSIDCLSRDTAGDYFLTRWISKQRKSHHVPITAELAARIQASAGRAKQKQGPKAKLLFGNKNDQPLSPNAFKRTLNQWAIECDIRDNNGQLYIPHFHQFRHTVGTRMINNGVSQHLVKRYLGHDSIDMTAVYAHLSDDTAKNAVADFLAQSDQRMESKPQPKC